MLRKIIVILGPTSSGKTSLAVQLAQKINGEIISADSRQVYIGMDIGTGKDLAEYTVPYHLIDVVSPEKTFDLADYQKKALVAIKDVLKRKKQPILVGGSGLYLQAIIDNYNLSAVKPDQKLREEIEKMSVDKILLAIKKINPKFYQNINTSDRQNKRRLVRYLEILKGEAGFKPLKSPSPYEFLILGLNPEREILNQRILQRLKSRLEKEDLVGEVSSLHEKGLSWQRLESFGLEYKYVAKYLQEELDYDQMVEKLYTEICRFAKRQMTWFKRMAKQGHQIHWIKNYQEAKNLIKS